MTDDDEIVAYQLALQRMQAANAHLGALLAKSTLAGGTDQVELHGPHLLPTYHLVTEHRCGKIEPGGKQADCTDRVTFHPGRPENCPTCTDTLAPDDSPASDRPAERITRGDARRENLPGRPTGLAPEERN